jgi:uncharacterized protein (DUF1778 family)
MASKSKVLNLRTTESEYDEIKKFAAFQGVSMSALVLESVREKIEDWEDMKAVREFEENPPSRAEMIPWEQVQKELGLV